MSSSLSASSSTSSSSSFTLSSLNRSSRSSSRPGVPTRTCAPSSRSRAMSAWMLVPPTSNASVVPLHSAQSFCATECTWVASSRVGSITMAPTWCFLSASARLAMSSYSGTKKASVLPDPVHACTATSWWRSRRGIAAACTGVAVAKPIECSARSVGGFSGGCSDSNGQSLEAPPAAAAGAAVGVTCAVVLDAVAAVALLATRRSALSERPPSRWQLFGAVPQRPCASLPPPLSPLLLVLGVDDRDFAFKPCCLCITVFFFTPVNSPFARAFLLALE
mmetsp:Transcript_1741/g.3565  ORF Transcript_1741/g.3565 Transcript_1741/m.3565 type:complete len:277 (+) Transcript_1741:1179-2009(+)